MNQTSNLYASAVLHARERTFLTEEVFRRLEGASLAEAGRILAECGWEDERAKLFALLREVGTCPTFLDCHASAEDYFNCRCALKFKQSGNATFRRLASPLGLIPAEKIFACVLADAPEQLPRDMQRGIRRSAAGEIDAALEQAYFAERAARAERLPERVLRAVFRLDADILNLEILLRCRALGLSASDRFLAGGEIPLAKYRRLDGKSDEDIVRELRGSECLRAVPGLETEEVERARRALPLQLLSGAREGVLAQARFYYRKDAEIRRVREILGAKKLFGRGRA